MNRPLRCSLFLPCALVVLVTSCTSQGSPSTQPLPSQPPTSVSTTVEAPTAVQMETAAPAPTVPDSPTTTPTLSIPAAAVVNGQPIPLQEYESQVGLALAYLSQQDGFDPNSEEGKAAIAQLRRQILEALIDQALIEQAAAREGLTIPEERVDTEIDRLIGDDPAKFDEWLRANGLTLETFRAQLQRQLLTAAFQERIVGSLPSAVEQVHARHILLVTEADAMDVLVKLHSGEAFAALAQQYSQDKGSSDLGGDLGFFPRGLMPAEIEAVAFALSPGQISGIVESDFGYHIIEVLEKDPARAVPEEMIGAWRQNYFLKWLEQQRAIATIEYLATVP